MTATFEIPGIPIAKKRPRFFRRGNFVGVFNAQETEESRAMLIISQSAKMLAVPIEKGVPVSLSALFVMPYPSSMSAKKKAANPQHVKKPDVDNMVKFLKDVCNGILWHDDSQVNYLTARKEYGENPRTVLTVEWGE